MPRTRRKIFNSKGVDFGTVLLDGFGNGIMINAGISISRIWTRTLLDSCKRRVRTSKTEFISCPSCGRTLFDLQTTVAMIKKHFSHLKHLKIGVMGCIVNGPGEMADADYGYVGAEHGKISLYKKKELVEKNIPQAEAVEHLIQLIRITVIGLSRRRKRHNRGSSASYYHLKQPGVSVPRRLL